MRITRRTGIAALALFAGLAAWLGQLDPPALALHFAFTPQRFALIVHAWPTADLLRYRQR